MPKNVNYKTIRRLMVQDGQIEQLSWLLMM